MSDVWSEGEAFGEIRSLVSRRPGADAFARVCELIDEAEEHAPGLYASRWRGYLVSHLQRWRSGQRAVRLERGEEAEVAARAPWAELVKGVDLVGFDMSKKKDSVWVATDLREAFPLMTHLGLERVAVRKAAVVSACAAGVFDGLSSVSFDDCNLHKTTFGILMTRLEERDEIEHLLFQNCGLGWDQFERVLASPLLPRLRSFGLPYHSGIDADMAGKIARVAPRFQALERLDLSCCPVAGAGAKALASASWGEAFAHLNLEQSQIRGMGLKALEANGLLGSLVDDEGERSLNLDGQQIGVKAFGLLIDSGVLEGVIHLNLEECKLTKTSSLERLGSVSTLRSLRLNHNAWKDGDDGVGLIAALESIDGVERLSLCTSGIEEDFMARLLESPAAAHLEYIKIDHWCPSRREDLEALLAWERLSECEVHAFWRFRYEDDPLISRALATGRFERDTEEGARIIQVGAGVRPLMANQTS